MDCYNKGLRSCYFRIMPSGKCGKSGDCDIRTSWTLELEDMTKERDALTKELAEVKAENARLREALEEISRLPEETWSGSAEYDNGYITGRVEPIDIARQALEGSHE